MTKNISKTLIVGLGGTGQTVIRELKKKLYEQYGEIPPLVRFLAFDTTAEDHQDEPFAYTFDGVRQETKRYNLQRDEFCQLSRPNLELMKKAPNCANLNFNALEEAYQKTSEGTNGSRIMGRAHFLFNAGIVITQLRKAVFELRNAQLAQEQIVRGYHVVSNALNVYVVASLAGGTGSSAIMDISRMLQHAGVNVLAMSSDTPSDSIFGMFFLPSFFKNQSDFSNNLVNTYAALSELDYTMSLGNSYKYPAGSAERDNDLNVYDGSQDYKAVRYSDVFLIDEKTKKGQIFSYVEAVRCVTSSIAQFIRTENVIPFLGELHAVSITRDVKGKGQYYSGLGYGEISFDRKRFVNYYLNKQLRSFLDQYYFDDTVSLDGLVEGFINSNGLNEGWKDVISGTDDRAKWNQLTDAILRLDDPEFASITMGQPMSGYKASDEINSYAQDYLSELEEVVKLRIGQFQNLKQQQLVDKLVAFLERHQRIKGFGRFPELAKRMVRSIVRMKEGLADEISYCLGRKHEMEESLKGLSLNISNNSSKGFLGIGNQEEIQKRFIEFYRMKVEGMGTEQEPTMARLVLEMARKKKAMEVYEQLESIVKLYYEEKPIEADNGEMLLEVHGKSVEARRRFDTLKSLLEQDIDAYKPSGEAVHQTIFADAYFKPYFDAHLAEVFGFTEMMKAEFDERIASVFEENNEVDVAMLNSLRNDLLVLLPESAIIKRVQQQEISIDDLFVMCYGRADGIDDSHDLAGNPQLKLFKRLEQMLDALWDWKDFNDENSFPVASNCFVGVFDSESNIFDRVNGYWAYLPATHTYQYFNMKDPDKIIFMLYETAIPAFILADAGEWAMEFGQRKESTYAFTDKRLESIDMLMPF